MGCSQSSNVVDGAQYKPMRSRHAARPETRDTPVRCAYVIRKRSIRIDPTRDLGQEPPASQGIGRSQDQFPLHLTDDEAHEILREVLDGAEPMEIDGVFSPLGSPDSLLQCIPSSKPLTQPAAEKSQKLASWEPVKDDDVFLSPLDPVNRPRTVSDDVKMIISQDTDRHPFDSVEWSQSPNLPAYAISSSEKQKQIGKSGR